MAFSSQEGKLKARECQRKRGLTFQWVLIGGGASGSEGMYEVRARLWRIYLSAGRCVGAKAAKLEGRGTGIFGMKLCSAV